MSLKLDTTLIANSTAEAMEMLKSRPHFKAITPDFRELSYDNRGNISNRFLDNRFNPNNFIRGVSVEEDKRAADDCLTAAQKRSKDANTGYTQCLASEKVRRERSRPHARAPLTAQHAYAPDSPLRLRTTSTSRQ